MKTTFKVVFDTNIFISAILFGGNPKQCLELARSGDIKLFSSKRILLELAKKMEEKFLWSENEIHELIAGITIFTRFVEPKQKVNVIKNDSEDNRVLECAQEANADYIISGDKKHLLSLKKFKGIPIFSAKEFLDLFYRK